MSITNIVDIHNHLLPSVDDGSQSFDETLRYLRAFHADGVSRLAFSPHLFGWLAEEPEGIAKRLDALDAVFEEARTRFGHRTDVPKLHFSQEILCSTPESARAVFETPRPGVRGTRYALVEFGFEIEIDCTSVVTAVIECGKRMIVSHPERYRRRRTPLSIEEILTWRDAGALLQVNGGSVLGDYGPAVEKTAWQLIEGGHAHIVSTDHHADQRVVSPAEAARVIAARCGEAAARVLLSENTGRILDDEELLPLSSALGRS